MSSIRCSASHLPPLACVITALAILGCSPSHQPPLGRVSGTVTLDGEALANATVRFTPTGPGRTSEGTTNAEGRYELRYLRDIPGANIDHHTVRITTASEANGGRELLPPRYHAQSKLEARVVAGTNGLDFALRSEGL
jgi:hypothetical protein